MYHWKSVLLLELTCATLAKAYVIGLRVYFENISITISTKWFSLQGELAQSLKKFLSTYIKFQRQNRKEKEEETEQKRTYQFTTR